MLLNRPRLDALLRADGLDAVVLTTPINVVYGSDFGSEFMLGRFEDHTTAVVLGPGVEPGLLIPEFDLPFLCESPSWIDDVRLYGNPWSSVGVFMGAAVEAKFDSALRRQLKTRRAALKPTQRDDFLAGLSAMLRARGLDKARLGCDDPRIAARLSELGIGGKAPIGDALWTMRRVRLVKTAAERAVMTEAARINADALADVIKAGRPGLREGDLTRVYRRHLVERDARHLGERGMMFGTGDASSFSLPQSADRALTPGDAIVLDCLGTWRGYHMDLARTGVVGTPTAAQKLRYDAVLAALLAVEDRMMKPGAHTADVRKLTRDTIAGFGLRGELVSVTTHAVGLEVFEFPYPDSLAKGFTLEEGMIVNTEVFYRDPELGSFHLEDSVAVEAKGCSLLAPLDRDLVVFA
ncbi:MAG: aminopeptidase P family protein [Alphaproteobacteria bacterium]|nr:aminopeptidase P family protein [Alphaproteobacteria bacterium]